MMLSQYIQATIMRYEFVRACMSLLVFATCLSFPSVASGSDIEDQAPLFEAVEKALASWTEFAAKGDVSGLAHAFLVGGPQYGQFMEESAAPNRPRRPDPLRFVLHDAEVRSLGTDSATLWTRVEATRVGFESQVFSWDFDLVRDGSDWKVWTVVPADRPRPAAAMAEPDPRPRLTLTTTSTTTAPYSPSVEREATGAPENETSPPPSTKGVRLPALSAWIIVITIVGVAAAGYLAPRLERRE